MDRVDEMEGITISALRIIKSDNGSVMHALKSIEAEYAGFGEAYFSTVECDFIKGWKKHTKMVSNLIVPCGEVQFVFFDDRENSSTKNCFFSINLSQDNYVRITAEPGIWMAFKGMCKGENIILNLANICHDPNEAQNDLLESSEIKYPL